MEEVAGLKLVSIIQYGLGQVGQALVRQVLAGREVLRARTGLELSYAALADSSGFLSARSGLTDADVERALAAKAQGVGLGAQAGGQAHAGALPTVPGPTVYVDVTTGEGMARPALQALERGWGAVLANKRPLAARLEDFCQLTASRRLRHEATVGAGLPWIEALTHLLDTGDRIERLEAAVSGTLGYIASRLEAGIPFSQAVAEARSRGYTEPDPREDLSAADVRRKGLILARMLGQAVGWEDLPTEALYPPTWNDLTVEAFMARLPELDAGYAARMASAQGAGRTLRYAVEVGEEGASARLGEVELESPLGRLQGADCLLAIYSARYKPRPLTISGPGAGPEVTAAGVYADIISLGMEL